VNVYCTDSRGSGDERQHSLFFFVVVVQFHLQYLTPFHDKTSVSYLCIDWPPLTMWKTFYPPKITDVFSMSSFACLLPHFSLFGTGASNTTTSD